MADATVWTVLAIYLAVLLGILVHSQVQTCRAATSGSAMEAHYLWGRRIPGAFLALTTVASVFSGYTVTGLPAEAYLTGFGYMRWVGLIIPMLLMVVSIAPRMVWLSKRRGYVSVLDVVRDRFVTGPIFPCKGCDVQGSVLHWLATVAFLIPSAIYLLAQFIAFSANMSALSHGALPQWAFGLFFFLLLATFEAVGGLRAVVLTDVFQGGVLILGVVAWLVVQSVVFGGVEAATSSLEREMPELLAPPAGTGVGSWFNFMFLVGGGRVVFPDILTRYVAAGNQGRVRLTVVVLAVFSFVVFPAMGLIGIHGRARYGGGQVPNSVFSQVCLEITESGWAGAIVGSLLLASSQAAIMSTADSVLMEVGKLMSLDVCQPLMRACGCESDESTILWIGRAMTFLMAGLCWLLTGWDALTMDRLSALLGLQNIFCCALAPLFFASLYSDSCPAWLASLSIAFGLVFGVLAWALKTNPETLVGEPEPVLPALVALANFALLTAALAALRRAPRALRRAPAPEDSWEPWRRALSERDALRERRAPEAGGEGPRRELPRPGAARPAEDAPQREPVHSWQVLLAVAAAIPALLPYGGADAGLRTWGVPDWALAFTVRMAGLALVVLYLVGYRWCEAPAGKDAPEVSCSLASSPVHAGA
ncbi:unnamed protein product [Prorocentrum cordatum]|uniref:Sodium/solute symporter n=1 Tax=Prorocentrum cordatum TaxID=2364126 RepID=A0ABN9Q0R8_9DINO|nr:unnamed protein product [Polarella glacialis]